jgi:MFS family permease
LLQKDNPERVGYVTAAMGMSQVLASLPAGCLARKWQRDTMLKLGSIVGAGAVGMTAVAITKSNFPCLIIALSLWGVMWGITDTALPSLFLDSIPDDEQNSYFRCGSRIIRSANFLGPLTALVIFHCLGNQWTISNCSIVMGIGLAFCFPVIFILCCLRDIKAGAEFDPPEEIHLQNPVHHGRPGLVHNESSDYGRSMSNEPEYFFGADVEEQGFDIDFDFDEHSRRRTRCCEEHVIVPTLITFADILSGIASGMSIRYFPVFFIEQLGLSPVSTQILYMIAPLGQAFFASLARRLAKSFGPSCVSVAFHWAFVIFLVSMLYCYLQGLSMWIVCSLYIVHTSLMNSTCSLSKVIMLNTVPEEDIHKWTVVETLQLFLWSGGAAVGGIVVGRKGIIFNFYVTAALQLFASLPLIILCCLGTKADGMNQGVFFSRMLTEDEDNAISIIAIEESEGEDD